jgi:hypothetical protein
LSNKIRDKAKGKKGRRSRGSEGPVTPRARNAEARGRPIVPVRIADEARAEPEPAAAEVPDRGEAGIGTGLRSEVVAGAVRVELLPAHEALGVGGGHRTDLEATETELVGPEHLTAPARRLSPVAETELRGDDHDRRLLLAGDGRERLDRARGAREPVGRELALAVVVEGARLGELLDEEVERAAVPLARVIHVREVLGRDGLDRRDGEPPLRQVGQRELREPPARRRPWWPRGGATGGPRSSPPARRWGRGPRTRAGRSTSSGPPPPRSGSRPRARRGACAPPPGTRPRSR